MKFTHKYAYKYTYILSIHSNTDTNTALNENGRKRSYIYEGRSLLNTNFPSCLHHHFLRYTYKKTQKFTHKYTYKYAYKNAHMLHMMAGHCWTLNFPSSFVIIIIMAKECILYQQVFPVLTLIGKFVLLAISTLVDICQIFLQCCPWVWPWGENGSNCDADDD